MSNLAAKQCIPCRGSIPPLVGAELTALQMELGREWQVVEQHHLERSFKFSNFRQALDFTIRVGEMAEEQNHHPVFQGMEADNDKTPADGERLQGLVQRVSQRVQFPVYMYS